MRLIFILIAGLFYSVALNAQDDDVFYVLQKKDNGTLLINQSPQIEQLVRTHIDLNKKLLGIKGYRIQIGLFSGRKAREKAYSLKSRYLTEHPDKTDIYISYSAPYFNVRMGNYHSKSEALKDFSEIKSEFPGAFIVEDFITVEDDE